MQNDLKNIPLLKNMKNGPSAISNVSPIIQMELEHPIFCFTVEFSDGTFQNFCMPYNEQNLEEIQKQMEKAHFAILSSITNSKS